MAPVRCVRQCIKTLFVHHLHQTLFLFKPCCSLFTPIPLERGTHMAQVRWRNETIPFGIRKTGLNPLAGILRKANPCKAPLAVAMPCYFPFTSLDYNSHQPIQETSATFHPLHFTVFSSHSYKKRVVGFTTRSFWEKVNHWLTEYDWRSNESYPSSSSSGQGQLASNTMSNVSPNQSVTNSVYKGRQKLNLKN